LLVLLHGYKFKGVKNKESIPTNRMFILNNFKVCTSI